MFSKPKPDKPRKRAAPTNGKPTLSQFGLLEVPNISDLALGGADESDDDADLEAELLALTAGKKVSRPKRKPKAVDSAGLDKMVAECLNDSTDDDHIDEDDPELLAELSALGPEEDEEEEEEVRSSESPSIDQSEGSPPKRPAPDIIRPSPFVAGVSVAGLLRERIQMYKEAEENAVAAGETARAKRFSRGLKTLNQMMKSVSQGKPINEEDIPPAVITKSSRNNSTQDLSEKAVEKPPPPIPSTITQNVAFLGDPLVPEAPHSNQETQNWESPAPPSAVPLYPDIPPESHTPRIGSPVTSHSSHTPPTNSSPASPINPPPASSSNPTQASSSNPIQASSIKPPQASLINPTEASPIKPPQASSINPSQALPSNPTEASSINPPLSPPINPVSLPPTPQPPPSDLSFILARQQDYKMAALTAKKKGDRESAIAFMRTVKQFEPLVQAAKEGKAVDLDSLPPPPGEGPAPYVPPSGPEVPPVHGSTAPSLNPNPSAVPVTAVESPKEQPPQEAPQASQASPSNPTSVLEALEQRLAKYVEQRDKAKENDDSRKVRMNSRIVKQFEDAIKAHKAGRTVNYEDLPTPPGFPPIPTGGGPTAATVPTATASVPSAATSQQPKPAAGMRPAPAPPVKSDVRKTPQSRVERQLSVLQRRQLQFKSAALEAKNRGEIEQAKEYLRNYKGFEQLIAATNGGLPVDMNTVPIPPQEKLGSENTSMDFEIINNEDCVFAPPETGADVALAFTKLEEDLIGQIKMCAVTREHFKALGDVASANRFEQLILHTKKDLDAVRVAFKRGDQPPRFHYENRSFTMIQCNTDLNDSDCEVTVIRGINFNVPNPTDVDTYVKIEFPYPSDAPPQERSPVVKDTNNPEFNHKVVFSIDRKARALSRVFKRHNVKCQVVTKGGWFHRGSVLGSVKVPLVPLETKCTYHDSFDLIDEKKKMVGGKLEVKIRVRNPILSKQLEKVTEKWVVIDGF